MCVYVIAVNVKSRDDRTLKSLRNLGVNSCLRSVSGSALAAPKRLGERADAAQRDLAIT